MLNRRNLITGAYAAAASALFLPVAPAMAKPMEEPKSLSRLDRMVKLIDPTLDLYNTNTKESLKVRFYTPTGYSANAIKQINWFMRDWREAEQKQFSVRCMWGLAAISQAARKDGNAGTVNINSGYRTRATNQKLRGAASDSFHMRAEAVDFVLPGAPVRDIANYATWLEVGGVGSYSRFIHIDQGPVRNWNG